MRAEGRRDVGGGTAYPTLAEQAAAQGRSNEPKAVSGDRRRRGLGAIRHLDGDRATAALPLGEGRRNFVGRVWRGIAPANPMDGPARPRLGSRCPTGEAAAMAESETTTTPTGGAPRTNRTPVLI